MGRGEGVGEDLPDDVRAGSIEVSVVDRVVGEHASFCRGAERGGRVHESHVVALRELTSTGEHSLIIERNGARLRLVVDPLPGQP